MIGHLAIGRVALVAGALWAVAGCAVAQKQDTPAAQAWPMQREFIYESAPFPSCHASTVEQTTAGPIIAAWFGGTGEGNNDVGIWVARREGGTWTAPKEVATGVDAERGRRYPCWNPVLFQAKDGPALSLSNGPLLLFYKVGPSPSRWWGMWMTSADGGLTWAKPRRLPEGFLGPIKNKPVRLTDGTLLCPSSTEDAGWRVHVERTSDLGATWTKTAALNESKAFDAIQPTVLIHAQEKLQLLCRSRQGRVTECWSNDRGQTWTPMKVTSLLNPNSGVDGVTLKDGRHLLVYNPVARGRTPLVVGLSQDGITWTTIATLEDQPGEYSYPAIIQAADGAVHITYTWKRQRIRHVVLRPPA